MNILFAGDIVGKPGRAAVSRLYPALKTELDIALFVANAENAAGGSGITRKIVYELHDAGVDIITLGDHTWRNKDIFNVIEEDKYTLRPANFPPGAPGSGSAILTLDNNCKVGVINLVGRIFMQPVDCPFQAADREVADLRDKADIIIVDIHAEATSEKIAMGRYLDGRVGAVLGTHTHVATADETILPRGTAYISDVGMTGPHESILGREVEPVLRNFTARLPSFFAVAQKDIRLSGVLLTIDETTGSVQAIERILRKLEEEN